MPFDSLSTSDPHPDWHDLLAGYALGNLSPEEQATLQQILTEQPELKADVQTYQETLALVPYALEPQALPMALEETIVAAAQAGQSLSHQTHRTTRPNSRQIPRQPSWYSGAIAAALLVAMFMGFDNYRLRQQQRSLQAQLETTQNQLQKQLKALAQADAKANQTTASFEPVIDILRQPNALVYSLKGTDEALTSSGSLLTLPDHSEVQLVSHNLPVLPADKVYRLWSVVTEESAPLFCGQFNNTEIGNVQWTVPDTLCNAKPVKVIITIDAVVDPPVPKGPAVLTGNI